MKELRPYQEVACDTIDKRLKNYKRPFIYTMSCGSGKSLVIAELAKRWGSVLVLTLSAELCRQDYEEMEEAGVDAAVYSASLGQKELKPITVATIGSAYRAPRLFEKVNIVIIDEVQSVNPAEPRSMFMDLLIKINKVGGVKIVGLTATPYRNVQRVRNHGSWYETSTLIQPLNRIPCGKGFLWGSIVEGITTEQALRANYLTPVEYYCEPQAIPLKVNSTGAEFTDKSLENWGNVALSRVLEVMLGCERRWHIRSGIVALPCISHVEALQAMCKEQGISSIVVSSKTPQKARREAITAFKEGRIKWLIQCNIANVGFNSPITDCLVWARPTMSLNLWQQAVGRIMRRSDGKKKARVMDLVGTLKTFGRVEGVHLGVEDGFKTTIVGDKGKLSGIPLKTFRWSSNIKYNTKGTI